MVGRPAAGRPGRPPRLAYRRSTAGRPTSWVAGWPGRTTGRPAGRPVGQPGSRRPVDRSGPCISRQSCNAPTARCAALGPPAKGLAGARHSARLEERRGSTGGARFCQDKVGLTPLEPPGPCRAKLVGRGAPRDSPRQERS